MGATEEGLSTSSSLVERCLASLTIDRRTALDVVDVDDHERVTIRCGGALHTAALIGGSLVLLDHDVAAELALLVFGAELPECLLYLLAWERATSDGFLEEWAPDADGDRVAHAVDDWHGNYWESWPSEPPAARALFGPRLQTALAVAVAARWVESRGQAGPGSAWSAVRRAVATRARRAVVLSLAAVDAHRRPDALVPVSISVTPDGPPAVEGLLSLRASFVDVRLPVAWLEQVWARGLALVDTRFVLHAEGARCLAVEWRPTGRPGREHVPSVVEVNGV